MRAGEVARATTAAARVARDAARGPPLVSARTLGRRYLLGGQPIDALAGLTLDLAPGEFLAVVGPSGSGKSTLLSLLGGLDRPTAGELLVAGRDLARLDSAEVARYRRETVGFVFQSFRLLAHLTALENVALPLLLAGAPRRPAHERARALLARVDLEQRSRHRPAELSGGEQQRTAIARALANRPRLLLADEPTGNLDATTSQAILQLLLELRSEQALALVIATHNTGVASRAERVLRLAAGRRVDLDPGA